MIVADVAELAVVGAGDVDARPAGYGGDGRDTGETGDATGEYGFGRSAWCSMRSGDGVALYGELRAEAAGP